ncbi:hypothetical protein ACJJTC_004946 [Scirpophaga incertulas]
MDLNLPKEMSLEGDNASNWNLFRKQLLNFMVAKELEEKKDEVKIAILLNCIGLEGNKIYETFEKQEGKLSFKKVLQEFDKYFIPRKNVVFNRYQFFKREQIEIESFDAFLTELRILANKCDFGDQLDSLVRDRIIIGVKDKALQERLLRENNISLEKTIEMCRICEISKKEVETIQNDKNLQVVDVINTKKNCYNKNKLRKFNCSRCGRIHGVNECPAYGQTCKGCGKLNHFQLKCKSLRKINETNINEVKENQCDQDGVELLRIDSMCIKNCEITDMWKETLILDGMPIEFKIDSGADVNILPLLYFEKLPQKYELMENKNKLTAFGGFIIDPVGVVTLDCKVKGKSYKRINFVVVKGDCIPILGRNTSVRLNLIQRIYDVKVNNSEEGITPDKSHVKSINNIKEPTNKKSLQKFLGVVTFLHKFIPNFSQVMAPLRLLLKKDYKWKWNLEQAKAFNELKKLVSAAPTLSFFDPSKDITIQTDASKDGLGACLMQSGRPVAFVSRSLTPAEVNYSMVEKELLGVCFAISKFHEFVYGHNFRVETDHKPLINIIGKDLHKATSRIQRLLLKLLKYTFTVHYIPGKSMYISDFLSRNYVMEKVTDDPDMLDVVHLVSVEEYLPVSKFKLQLIRSETQKDVVLSKVIQYINNGWQEYSKLNSELHHYYKLKDNLIVKDNIIFLRDKLIVPKSLYLDMLKQIHGNAHLGLDIAEHRGNYYLITVDYLSKWFDVIPLVNKSVEQITLKLVELFSVHGLPKFIVCDNSPFNSFSMLKFCRERDIDMIFSSPYHPKSNGLAEKSVGIAKKILKKSNNLYELYDALLEYRVTPVAGTDFAPCQLLMGRLLRSKLPTVRKHLNPKIVINTAYNQQMKKRNYNEYYYNKNASCSKEFNVGDSVTIRNAITKVPTPCKILKKLDKPRSYLVQNSQGKAIVRNSLFLRHSPNSYNLQDTVEVKDYDTFSKYCNTENEIRLSSYGDSNNNDIDLSSSLAVPAGD